MELAAPSRAPLARAAEGGSGPTSSGGANNGVAANGSGGNNASTTPLRIFATPIPPEDRPLEFHSAKAIISCLLSFVGGFIDAAMYQALFELFTANVTGNLVIIVSPEQGARTSRVVVTAVFAAGAMLASALAHASECSACLRGRRHLVAALLFLLETALLVSVVIAGLLLRPRLERASIDTPVVLVVASLASLAMGLQNGIARTFLMPIPPTTIMTSVAVSASLALIDLLVACTSLSSTGRRPIRDRRRAASRLAEFAFPLAAFIGGAALGAFLQKVASFYSVLVPVAAVLAVAADVARIELSPAPPPPAPL